MTLDLPAILSRAREAKALAEKATPGPWQICTLKHRGVHGPAWVSSEDMSSIADCSEAKASTDVGFCGIVEPEQNEANAAFIAAARSSVPRMAADIKALCAEVARLRKALRFYARHEHWMAITSDPDCASQLLVALSGQLPPDGWAVAEDALK